ncbi:MAG: hypothetical protein PHV36_15135 [Elusimicrobiales bacterium]|nr:hypothetical protein [Elusimicrobiales bacterium]
MKKILFAAALIWSAAAYAADFETLAVRASDLKASAWTQAAAQEPAAAVYQPAENSLKSARRTEFRFEIKPLPTGPSSRAEIEQGLLDLYKNDIPSELLAKEIKKSGDFQDQVYSTLNAQISQNKNWPVTVTERRLTGNFVKETTVRFPSLIQRPGGHASNMVVARIYEPATQNEYCSYRYPTTIMLHHILNEVGMIEDVAKVMSAGVLAKPAIVVVIHMPHYGERRQGSEEFLNSNMEDFRKNMAQLVLDVHLLRNYLETRGNVDTTRLSLSGISLGSVMGLTVGAFDQGFTGYGYLVGGVDMANILMNRVHTRPDSEVAVALRNMKPEENSLRNELAAVDGMTWLHRYQGKKMFLLSASQDDIVDYMNSVTPMIRQLEGQGNALKLQLNNDSHSPTGSAIKKLRTVFLPLLDFAIDNAPNRNMVCNDPANIILPRSYSY